MAMNETMLWLIGRPLLIDGRNMKCTSNFGMTMAIPFLVHQICIPLSLSPMMNQYSSKMTRGKPVGTIKTASQPPNQKARGNHWWSQTSWPLSGDACVMVTGESLLLSLIALLIDHSVERPVLCSNQARIGTDTSMQINSLCKLILPSISLRPRQMALLRAFSCLIMPLVTWSMLQMRCLPPRWSKVRPIIFL